MNNGKRMKMAPPNLAEVIFLLRSKGGEASFLVQNSKYYSSIENNNLVGW